MRRYFRRASTLAWSRDSHFIKIFRSPEALLLGGFAAVILLGAIILKAPFSHTLPHISFVDTLFTSTSAVCVTGLAVLDTGTEYSVIGQVTIMALVQVGGLGIMTFAALVFFIMGRRMSLQSQALVSDTFLQRDAGTEFKEIFRNILLLTFAIEGAGVLIMFLSLVPYEPVSDALFSAVFHSVSAFCNAGFSIYKDNLIFQRNNYGVSFTIMGLIVLGGLGFAVLNEIWSRFKRVLREKTTGFGNPMSLNSRVVLRVTFMLLTLGTIAMFFFGMTKDEVTFHDKVLGALFQSVTARTAGFNTVDIGKLPSASLLILMILMFIGGSPASCAGGIKTTTSAILFGRLMASLHGRTEVQLLERRIPQELVNRADLLFGLAVIWNTVGFLFLLTTQSHLNVTALDLMFEQISAFGTVGLSTGLTANLTDSGKLWLCATMYMGRLGPLTVALWMFPRSKVQIGYPKGTVMIG
jgi:trk system potassium uptake protein